MAISIGDAVLKVGCDVSDLDKGLQGIDNRLKSAGASMTQWGKNLSLKVTAPIVGLGVASFKMAGDFDQAFRKVNVMLGASTEEAEKYKKSILEISSATGKSAVDVADAFYQIVSAGYRGADAIDILNVAMKGATGGAADTIATTAALTKAMNIFKLEGVEGSSRAMDTFFGIVDTGLLTFEEMAHSFPIAASMAAGLGVEIEEVGAALGTLTKVSGSTEEAATALNATFTALVKPSEAMQKLYEEWGVKNGPEAIKQFGGLEGVLRKVQEATGGEVDALAELFPNVRAVRAILPLVTTNSEDFAAALDTVKNATGRTGEAFEEMAQGPGFQWQQMMVTLKNASITLGDTVAKTLGPWLEKLMGWIKKLVDWFGNLSPRVQKIIIIALGLAAALGPVLMILGMMLPAIGAIVGILPVLGAAFTVCLGPIGLIIAAIAAVIAIGILVWKNWDTIKEKAIEIWTDIGGFFSKIGDSIKNKFQSDWETIRNFASQIWGDIQKRGEKYGGGLKGTILGAYESLLVGTKKILEAMGVDTEKWGQRIRNVWDALVNFFRNIPEKIRSAFSTLKDIMLAPFRLALNAIESAINWLIKQINKISFTIPDWVPIIGGKHFGFDIPEIKLPTFDKGGLIPEPTLLYGLRSMRPYATARQGEAISPVGTGITNIFNDTYNIEKLVVRDKDDIRRIAVELERLRQSKGRQLGVA